MKLTKLFSIIALSVVLVSGCKKDDDEGLPKITSSDPAANATGVARNKEITVVFSEEMNPLTINTTTFKVTQGTTPVAGTVSYFGKTAIFTPGATFAAATPYTITITNGAKSLSGNAFPSTEWKFTTGGNTASVAAVALGSSGNYVILAKTAINNSPTSAVTGDMGLSPAATSYIREFSLVDATGYATSAQVTGKVYAADMASPTSTNLTTAVNNMLTAYNDAAGRPLPDFIELGSGNIGGKTLTPGLYKWTNTVTIPNHVTISGSGTDVWIFQIAGGLTMSSAMNITLTGGALPQNVFWQVAEHVTIGTDAHFEGVILSMKGITFQTNASLKGRALAQTAVVLDKNVIVKPN